MTIRFQLRKTNSWAYSIDEYDKKWNFKWTESSWNKLEINEKEAEKLSNEYWTYESWLNLDQFYQKIVEYIWVKNWDDLFEEWIFDDSMSDIIEESISWKDIDELNTHISIWDKVRTNSEEEIEIWKVSSMFKDEKENIKVKVIIEDLWNTEKEFFDYELIKIDEKKKKIFDTFINANSSWSNKEKIIQFTNDKFKEQITKIDDIQLVYDSIEWNKKINITDKVDIIWSIWNEISSQIDKRVRELERIKKELANLEEIENMWISLAMRALKESWDKEIKWTTHKFMKTVTSYVDVTDVDKLPDSLKEKIEYYQPDKKWIKKAIENWEKIQWAEIKNNEFFKIKQL